MVKSLHIGQVIVSTWLIVILRVVDTSYLREDRLYTVRYRDYRYRGRPFSARCCPAPPEETSRAGPPGGIYLSIIIILHRYRAQCEVSSDARKFNVFRMSPHPADVTLTLSQNVRSRAPQDPATGAGAPGDGLSAHFAGTQSAFNWPLPCPRDQAVVYDDAVEEARLVHVGQLALRVGEPGLERLLVLGATAAQPPLQLLVRGRRHEDEDGVQVRLLDQLGALRNTPGQAQP